MPNEKKAERGREGRREAKNDDVHFFTAASSAFSLFSGKRVWESRMMSMR